MILNKCLSIYNFITDPTGKGFMSEMGKKYPNEVKTSAEAPNTMSTNGFANTEQTIRATLPPRDLPLPDLDADVHSFLAKPVKIYTSDWLVGTEPADFDPWTLFFNNLAVKRKISNYLLISGKLKLHILTNGSGFQYGLISAAYCPRYSNDVFRTQPSGMVGYASQNLPFRFYIDASRNQSIEVELPWTLGSEGTIPLGSYNSIGTYIILEEAPLLSASAGPLDPKVSIAIYASLHDAKIQYRTGSTISDYKGVLSKPLEMMSKTAAKFSKVPLIGAYATTTSEVAKGASDLATLFGFSAPNNLNQPVNSALKSNSSLASTINVDGGEVLATDPRAATMIDPSLLGLHSQDEMVISEIVQRYSLVAKHSWTLSQGTGTDVFSFSNSPFYTDQSFPCSFSHVAFATYPFRYFRGTLKYKFRIPCAAVHTGRIQIWHEPYVDVSGNDITNVVENVIYDLSSDSEVILEVPYTFPTPAKFFDAAVDTVADLINASVRGTIRARVVTPLKCAGVSANVSILVYIAAGDDWQVMAPNISGFDTSFTRMSYIGSAATTAAPATVAIKGYQISSEVQENVEEIVQSEPDVDPPIDITSYLISSERVVSFRNLVKRFCMVNFIVMPTKTPIAVYNVTGRAIREFPINPGITKTSGATYYGNAAQWGWLNYLGPAYMGYRGGTRHKFIGFEGVQSMFASRYENSLAVNECFAYNILDPRAFRSIGDGAAMVTTSEYERKVLEVTSPYRESQLYINTRQNISQYEPRRSLLLGVVGTGANPSQVLHLTAGADDFSLLLYLGSPVIFRNLTS